MPEKQDGNRNSDGKFKPGVSGNPSGRPRSEVTRLREQLTGHADEVIAQVIEAARNGDMAACKLVLDRIAPPLKPSTAPVSIELPDDAGLAEKAQRIIHAAGQGDISPDVAAGLVQAVGALAKIVETDELERRLTEIEKRLSHDTK